MADKRLRRTGVVHSERFKDHFTGDGHPENPSRIGAIGRAVKTPSLAGRLSPIPTRSAEREEILIVHTERLYQEVLSTRDQDVVHLDEDTVTSPESADVALTAVGSVLNCVDHVLEGEVGNAFAFVRPPGHHAKPDRAMGFCLFNNIAIGAQHALRNRGLSKVLIIDFDLHHGNGTQKAFYTSPEVLYISTHQWPHYPGTGGLEECGKEEGEGYTVNVPLPTGMGDFEYLRIFRELVAPLGREFAPDVVLVSAGFDTHHQDPLGSMEMTHAGYGFLTQEILAIADACCSGKAVFVLEGGYGLPGLEKSVASMLEVATAPVPGPEATDGGESTVEIIEAVRSAYWKYWRSL
jgi:acetoin utilization deacetylase AcuC-like enzyme